jgi:membrane protein required for colicin V production
VTIDLIILGVVLFFALLGALSGAAKQLANVAALAVALFVSRVLGPELGPRLAAALDSPLVVGVVLGSVLVFLGVLVAVRYALVALLRRLFGVGNPERREADRLLGMMLGGVKALGLAYVLVSALVLAEQNVVVAGKRFGLSPKDSVAFSVARRFNVFDLPRLTSVRDLMQVAQASKDPEQARRLAKDPAYKSLQQDPRLKRVLADREVREAVERGDYPALMREDAILQLLRDPEFVARLSAAANRAEYFEQLEKQEKQ